MILEQAQGFDLPGIGLLLDQEKAYDRVHPTYLAQVMSAFGFPSSFTHCIGKFFFGNHVSININGFFTNTVDQQRGLRQGDPLSPLLFNLALEPFLLSIHQDAHFQGYHPPAAAQVYHPQPIKFLAYTDDVCVFIKDQSDLQRLDQHMLDYSEVSNAKFNDFKSEAFSLNRKHDLDWVNLLATRHINTYLHQGSHQVLRYLGFFLPYTTTQRSYLENQLLSSFHAQCRIYSQRQLSIRGRVTILNILISTKLWYCLRLFRPTKQFFTKVGSMMYQFIWQNKSPRLAKALIFAPWDVGGLKVIHPEYQHKALQRRWLGYLTNPGYRGSFIAALMVAHLSLLHRSKTFPPHGTLGSLCSSRTCYALLALHLACHFPILRSFYSSQWPMTTLPLATNLELPLFKILLHIDETHWSRCHPTFLTSQFMVFDQQQQRLRLKVPGECTHFPRLCQRLFAAIITDRTIGLADFVWVHVTQPPPSSPPPILQLPLLSTIDYDVHWRAFRPSLYRLAVTPALSTSHQFTHKSIKLFWKCPMYLQARTVFYRALTQRIPHNGVIFQYGSVSSSTCSFCHKFDDSRFHFLVGCPKKWPIWQTILRHFYPTLFFTPRHVYRTLQELHFPTSILNHQQYLTIISHTLWQLWNFYWLHDSGNSEPVPTTISAKIPQHIFSKLHFIHSPPS